MRIQTDIGVDVTVHYLDIEGLRFAPQAGKPNRLAEFHAIRATTRLNRDGTIARVYLSGIGKWLKADGTVGLRDAKLVFSSGTTLPAEWKKRIETDLQRLAGLVIIGELRAVQA